MYINPMSPPGVRGFSPTPRTTAPATAYLIIFTDISDETSIIKLEGTMALGREIPGSKPDIALASPIISRKHGVFSVRPDGFFYEDLGSFNGTFINGVLYKSDLNPMNTPVKLHDGDILRFDSRDAKKSHKNAITVIFSTSYDKRSKWRRYRPSSSFAEVGVARNGLIEFEKGNMIAQNAVASINEFGCTVNRTSERNNVFYNNSSIGTNCHVRNRDVFRIDQNYLYFEKGEFLYNVCLATEPGLDVNLVETHVPDKFKKKVLLKDINLSIDKGDFALIIGGSGAGKSTFMNSILGKYDIVGNIMIGGRPTGGDQNLTSAIAYVPQTLPLRKEERLIDVVTDTCLLRCKTKMNNDQRRQFILNTLESLGLRGKADMEIKKLSGGEQRRAAIANEVVTDSSIFFLDEPDSGLDPKSGMELMNNLKALSDKGKIVMLISHNYASYPCPEKIYSKIIILAKSNRDGIGRLAFAGSVEEALNFFNVEELKDITKLINPVSENGEGRADEFVDKYRRMCGRG